MCGTCGCDEGRGDCGGSTIEPVDLHERILAGNDRRAAHNRRHFRERGLLAINVMGSPGAGKTALLEATARALAGRRAIGALAGDLATDYDAARLSSAGIRAHSITTGMACHLDAAMVHRGLHELPLNQLDYLFIENVGNLVCPAVYDLGQAANVVLLSVTEGEDKPLKYPVMFRVADLVLITKTDLLPQLPEIDVDRIVRAIEQTMPVPRAIALSTRSGQGFEGWIDWLLHEERKAAPAEIQPAAAAAHHG
jgi:hydrogenase nickel incorporation protein HypB